MGKRKIFHAYRGQDLQGLKKGGDGSEGQLQLGEAALKCFKSWFPKSPNSSDQKRKWKFLCTQIYQLVHSNQWQLVLEHFLLISILKIQIWNTGISFLFDHVVPQWPAGPLRSNHFYFCNRNLSNNRIFPNNRRKSINQTFISIRHFSINNRNISIKHSSSRTEYK